MDEKARFKSVQDRFRDLIKPLRQVADKKWGNAAKIEEFEKLLAAIPKGAAFGDAVDSAAGALREVIAQIRSARAEGFGRIVSEYIRELKAQGTNPTEIGHKWRMGAIELELKPEASQARVLYNQSSLLPASAWQVITTKEDLIKLRTKALEMLKDVQARLPDELVKRLLMDCYQMAVEKRRAAGKPRPEMVPILDLHRAFRVALVADELDGQKPDKTLASAAMPRWAFLHVLDRYQRMATTGEQKDRLTFQTGSQAEQAKGLGYMLGGLDPHQKYRIYCHVLLNS